MQVAPTDLHLAAGPLLFLTRHDTIETRDMDSATIKHQKGRAFDEKISPGDHHICGF
jgi:hypothetical protein